MELNILLQDKELANMLDVVEVLDHEMVIKYENGILSEVLKPGRYAYWRSIGDQRCYCSQCGRC
ncbi:hypothetical protein JCM21142_3918 [Saccharicrinis fermentans DSM 9555 = JCM 21142]|uniref:Uncharacterized protein n=1 Tax=Saccharicrinis fermentans DSM 9555 = JCM 21142 TaxID=869213 RepID=W7YIA2_9BACT|nr:hypothetical protein JCM21142_3918 [Saccharicrinis fermentans DSM 9555 = JCM 21142]